MGNADGSMDAGSYHGSAVKGSTIDLEVAGSSLVSCHFSLLFFLTMCSSLAFIWCLRMLCRLPIAFMLGLWIHTMVDYAEISYQQLYTVRI